MNTNSKGQTVFDDLVAARKTMVWQHGEEAAKQFDALVAKGVIISREENNAQQSVQPTASGVGKRGHFANLLVSLGKYLVKLGGG